jgi:hypothetical protein
MEVAIRWIDKCFLWVCRTYFPDAYRKHYPNAKTHISSRVRSVDSNGNPLFGENAVRRERKQFSPEEDAALKRGYVKVSFPNLTISYLLVLAY